MSAWRHRFRVMMVTGKSRDVMAQSPDGARRTAERSQRLVGYKGLDCKAIGPGVDLGRLGTDAAYCPICTRRGSLFDDAKPEEQTR